MDLLTDILQIHYDSRWVVSNTNQNDLTIVSFLDKCLERLISQKISLYFMLYVFKTKSS